MLRRTPPPALVSRDLCCNVLLLRRWCHATCVATYSSSGVGVTRLVLRGTPALVSRDLCCGVLLIQCWCHATCVATYPSSGVGVTRLVLRRTPHPALVSRDCVATYPFSHVKSKRLLPLVGNPWHETHTILIHHLIWIWTGSVAYSDHLGWIRTGSGGYSNLGIRKKKTNISVDVILPMM